MYTSERRRFGRRDTTIHAVVDIQGGRTVACVVRNLSEGGALIELFTPAELPQQLGLRLPNTKVVLPCEVVRVSGRKLGVEFKPQTGSVGAEGRRALREAGLALIA